VLCCLCHISTTVVIAEDTIECAVCMGMMLLLCVWLCCDNEDTSTTWVEAGLVNGSHKLFAV